MQKVYGRKTDKVQSVAARVGLKALSKGGEVVKRFMREVEEFEDGVVRKG